MAPAEARAIACGRMVAVMHLERLFCAQFVKHLLQFDQIHAAFFGLFVVLLELRGGDEFQSNSRFLFLLIKRGKHGL